MATTNANRLCWIPILLASANPAAPWQGLKTKAALNFHWRMVREWVLGGVVVMAVFSHKLSEANAGQLSGQSHRRG
jgi:hypothetical protein